MRVFGIDVDFSNLRAEDYHDTDSRIPSHMRFGTPLQDAERRDFTINSLFYNLSTEQVEDWTKRGLRDLLIDRILETPLDPVQTFRDDPLRVLRAIRFSVRYELQLAETIHKALLRSEIRQALKYKVSRERVGKELEGMLSGKHSRPTTALLMLAHLRLGGSVFPVPPPGLAPEDPNAPPVSKVYGSLDIPPTCIDPHEPVDMLVADGDDDNDNGDKQVMYSGIDHESSSTIALRQRSWEEAERFLPWWTCVEEQWSQMMQLRDNPPSLPVPTSAILKTVQRLCPIASFLLPWRGLRYDNARRITKDFWVVTHMFQHGIKFRNVDVNAITTIMALVDPMATLLSHYADSSNNNGGTTLRVSRLQAGLLLREAKDMWIPTLLVATVLKLRHQSDNRHGPVPMLLLTRTGSRWHSNGIVQ